LAVDLRQYDSFGNVDKGEKVHPKKLIGIRMQLKSICSEFDPAETLGSVVYA
jgi:hypothetical protein